MAYRRMKDAIQETINSFLNQQERYPGDRDFVKVQSIDPLVDSLIQIFEDERQEHDDEFSVVFEDFNIDEDETDMDIDSVEAEEPEPVERKYEVIETIGGGEFSEVFKIQHHIDRKLYAMKKIKIDSEDDEFEIDVTKEAQILSTLNHEHIVQYSDSWQEQGFLCIRMGFYKMNLEQALDQMRLVRSPVGKLQRRPSQFDNINPQDRERREVTNSINQLLQDDKYTMVFQWQKPQISPLRIFAQVSSALKYLHEKFVMHRDLKPSNIFLDDGHNVKLGDFGLSRQYNRQSKDFAATYCMSEPGSSLYAAPEVTNLRLRPSKLFFWFRADVYSLAVVFFELVFSMYDIVEMDRNSRERPEFLSKLKADDHSEFIERLKRGTQNCYIINAIQGNLQDKNCKFGTKDFWKLLEEMLVHEPERRKSSKEVVKSLASKCPSFHLK